MIHVCDYSSLIFAGNTTVLLILSLTTDYWEYRGFDLGRIISEVNHTVHKELAWPFDTKSYLQIHFKVSGHGVSPYTTNMGDTIYYPPLFIKKLYTNGPNGTMSPQSGGTILSYQVYDTISVHHVQETETSRNKLLTAVEAGYHDDITRDQDDTTWEVHHEVNLFQQYGNLFRDCDALEAGVRKRLGLSRKRSSKCVYFDTARESSSVYLFAPELTHLEASASACALLCMVAIVIGSFSGSYGLFSNYTCLKAYKLASCMSLIAGFFLTLSIALFQGKCYTLRKLELLPGHALPFKQLLNDSRTYSYGWSFFLAWICVCFCYTSSYVWLCKSQGPSRGRLIQRFSKRKRIGKRTYLQYIEEDNYSVHDIATV